jgi:hypothetical protein
MHSWPNFWFHANQDNQPNRQMVRYTLHQYKEDKKTKKWDRDFYIFLLKDLLALSGPQHCRISFGQTQLLLLIGLYCMLLLPCHVLPVYKRCIKIHSTDESHDVWSMDVQVVALCIMTYGNHRVYKRSSQFTDYTMELYHGLYWGLDRQHSQYNPLQAAWYRDWICTGQNFLHLSRSALNPTQPPI